MTEQLFNTFLFAGKEMALFIISMIPIVELRLAIPLGAALQMDWRQVFLIAFIGNCLPIPFIILFGRAIINWLKRTRMFGKFIHRYEEKLLARYKKVEKYAEIGLCIFVAIPLPGTGAWSGAVLAALLEMKFWRACFWVALGVLGAGIIVTLVSYGAATAVQIMG